MAAADLLGLIALVIVLAVAAELIGDRIGVPNFVFFVLAGIAVGPVGMGILHHDMFGKNLAAIVGLAVALILFNSGTTIDPEMIRDAPRTAFLLPTIGLLVTFFGMAAVTYRVMGVAPGIALLIGALLVATGSTVIIPIVESVPMPDRLAHTLEIEALSTEVTAGILAVAVFHAVTLTETAPRELAVMFVQHLLIGILIGAVVAGIVVVLFLLPEHAPEKAPTHASRMYLATAITTFALAEQVAQESGVAAAATAGVVLGSIDLPHQEYAEEFQEELTTFILAFIFVVLASFVEPEWLRAVGREGLIVAGALILLVRPAAVLLSSVLSRLSLRERLFLAGVGPRGIIPAGLATLLALEIQGSNPEAAATITGTVLLVIVTTTLVEGIFAGKIARGLGVTTAKTIVVGGGRFGLGLADRYDEAGEQVIIVETNRDALELARESGFAVYEGDGSNEDVLRKAGAETATKIVAATDDDNVNLKVAHIAAEEFDVNMILARLNQKGNASMFDHLDVALLTGSQLDLWALEHLIDQSAPEWLTAFSTSGEVGSFSVGGVDATAGDIEEALPKRAWVATVSRNGETWVPKEWERVQYGDELTILGRPGSVEESAGRLRSISDRNWDGSETTRSLDTS